MPVQYTRGHSGLMSKNMAHILVIEDEEDIRDLVHFNLLKEGHKVTCATNGLEGLDMANQLIPDLIILDLMMPKMDGMEVCRRLRSTAATKEIPILMVTAKSSDEDAIAGLQQGADDYVSKPFSPKVLMARVESVLRRLARAKMPLSNESREINGLTIDPDRRKVIATATGQELDLTYSEFEILLLLASKPGWVFTRSQIVDSIRGSNHAITDRSVDVQIVGLRRKLGDLGNIIETVRGAGYRFKE